MNKSEIAEKARIEKFYDEFVRIECQLPDDHGAMKSAFFAGWERAIAESQAWISVEEKLPPEHAQVLAVDIRGQMGTICRPWTELITHWMPLPNPPKGNENV